MVKRTLALSEDLDVRVAAPPAVLARLELFVPLRRPGRRPRQRQVVNLDLAVDTPRARQLLDQLTTGRQLVQPPSTGRPAGRVPVCWPPAATGGTQLLRLADITDEQHVIEIDAGGSDLLVTCLASGPETLTVLGLRTLTQLQVEAARQQGGMSVFGAAVHLAVGVVLVAGLPGAGKLQLAYRLAHQYGAGLVGSCRQVLVSKGADWWVRGLPLAWRLDPRTTGTIPHAMRRLREVAPAAGRPLTLGRSQRLPAAEAAEVFSTQVVPSGPLAGIVVARRSDLSGPRWSHLLTAQRPPVLRATCLRPTPPDLDWSGPDPTGADRCLELARQVPMYAAAWNKWEQLAEIAERIHGTFTAPTEPETAGQGHEGEGSDHAEALTP